MNKTDSLRKALIDEIEQSGMGLQRKLRIMELMDQAFREHLGVFFLTDEELEKRDILNRSF